MSVGGKSGSGPASYGYGQHSGYAPTQQQQNVFNQGVLPSNSQANQQHYASPFDAGAQGPSFKNPFTFQPQPIGQFTPQPLDGGYNQILPQTTPTNQGNPNGGLNFANPPQQLAGTFQNGPGGNGGATGIPYQNMLQAQPLQLVANQTGPGGSATGLGNPPSQLGGGPGGIPALTMPGSMQPQNLYNQYSNALLGTGPGAAPQALNPQVPTQNPGSDVVFRPS